MIAGLAVMALAARDARVATGDRVVRAPVDRVVKVPVRFAAIVPIRAAVRAPVPVDVLLAPKALGGRTASAGRGPTAEGGRLDRPTPKRPSPSRSG